ncbi:MAG: tryptophan-rich sensory protein, partial [Clostridia bacterium]|nr:tryptophan-rich sensory protein [Clostridia bacterium]
MKEKVKSYVVSILIALTAGGLSAILTMGNMDIYNTLKTPPLSPPSILFPIVWTVLYIVMGVSAAMIYNTAKASHIDKSSALFTYAISLIFNFLWSIIFFNMR